MCGRTVLFVTMRNQLLRMVTCTLNKNSRLFLNNFVGFSIALGILFELNHKKVLEFAVHGDKVKTWIDIDDDVWTTFLSEQPGYISKGAYYPQDCDLSKSDHCLVS